MTLSGRYILSYNVFEYDSIIFKHIKRNLVQVQQRRHATKSYLMHLNMIPCYAMSSRQCGLLPRIASLSRSELSQQGKLICLIF
jgi:hypothetical protein